MKKRPREKRSKATPRPAKVHTRNPGEGDVEAALNELDTAQAALETAEATLVTARTAYRTALDNRDAAAIVRDAAIRALLQALAGNQAE